MKILLVTPPLLQFNNPFPATAYLTGYLQSRGYSVEQRDFSLELILKIFSADGLSTLQAEMLKAAPTKPNRSFSNDQKLESGDHRESARFFLDAFADYRRVVEPVVGFLQGKNPSLATRIAGRTLLPEGPRFLKLATDKLLKSSFGSMGVQDQAKFLASLFMDDICDAIQQGADPDFELSRYAERLGACQPSFTPLYERLHARTTVIDRMLQQIVEKEIREVQPDLLGLSVPFPGNLYGALRCAQFAKTAKKDLRIAMGGGYVNTELRDLKDPRIFEFVDYLTLDDGEKPLECLAESLRQMKDPVETDQLVRTLIAKEGHVTKVHSSKIREVPFKDHPGPTYVGLDFSRYISMFEMLNPAHRLWSDFKWNKMILAHGCYWHKCTFCDTSLDYISRYEPDRASAIVDKMERLRSETGQSGFHFVDEAAPPALLKAVAQETLKRGLVVSWWSNIRFEKTFDSALTELLADSGCVAVTGGIEVASDRILSLIDKGVTIEQVARVTKAFTDSRILVHAYLMYGFPTQTVQETVDSLEVVRQLFSAGCLTSAYWHRFAATLHSPVGHNPQKFGIELIPIETPETESHGRFATNDVGFREIRAADRADHAQLGEGLRLALYNYMHGIGLDADVREWFEVNVPKTKIPKSRIRNALKDR